MEGMKLATICVIWCMMAVVASSAVVEYEEIGEKPLGYVTFELARGVQSYSSFLTRLRNAVEAPTRACGLQSTRITPLPGTEYGYANLLLSNTEWITLGIETKNLYVWAYQDNVKYDGKYRANFLSNAPTEAKSNLFSGSTIRISRLPSDYTDLERAARASRYDLILGIEKLRGAMRGVYGRQENQLNQGKEEAKFLLLAIQMVAEAARFKFMEEGIVRNDNTPYMKLKMVAFENDWNKISKAIHQAEGATPKCIKITPTLVISNIGYRQEVNEVAEIINDIGILKYYG
ncbi:hypothetical protein DCAR_0933300 [Daucus carota subsp. sativus]|uniref:rRNA N-glycosylase n=1 Tax=Daucus carota subsp. sativus TaxID=79200 RepID=A0A175YDJ0_DAUCS|nr:PREDICTED: ribosome-inactivating protein lychnin-like [Daucus carota subsp. sativus]WOH13789.1 hypothetical protein DCAR_0933300 [Daucus carota subsp. sativus]